MDMVWLLNVKLGAVQSTYMAKLEIENWSAAYRAHCRSISCAFPAAYRAQLRRYPARTGPHHTVRIQQHIVRLRSLSCAFPAAYRAQLRRYPALAHVALCNLRTVRCVYLHLNRFG